MAPRELPEYVDSLTRGVSQIEHQATLSGDGVPRQSACKEVFALPVTSKLPVCRYEYVDDLPALHISCEAELLGNDARVLHTSPAQTRNQSTCNCETKDRFVRAIEVHTKVRGTDEIGQHREHWHRYIGMSARKAVWDLVDQRHTCRQLSVLT